MEPYPARVTWLDASRTEETLTASMSVGIKRKTLGWILRDDYTGIVIAMSRDGDEYERGFTIPRAYVVKVRRLKEEAR